MTLDLVSPTRAFNGKQPVWHARFGRLFWVDIREPALHAFDPATGRDQHREMPTRIGCFGFTEHGAWSPSARGSTNSKREWAS